MNDKGYGRKPNLRYKKRTYLVRLRKFTRSSFRIADLLGGV
jgi:hypothetical protein